MSILATFSESAARASGKARVSVHELQSESPSPRDTHSHSRPGQLAHPSASPSFSPLSKMPRMATLIAAFGVIAPACGQGYPQQRSGYWNDTDCHNPSEPNCNPCWQTFAMPPPTGNVTETSTWGGRPGEYPEVKPWYNEAGSAPNGPPAGKGKCSACIDRLLVRSPRAVACWSLGRSSRLAGGAYHCRAAAGQLPRNAGQQAVVVQLRHRPEHPARPSPATCCLLLVLLLLVLLAEGCCCCSCPSTALPPPRLQLWPLPSPPHRPDSSALPRVCTPRVQIPCNAPAPGLYDCACYCAYEQQVRPPTHPPTINMPACVLCMSWCADLVFRVPAHSCR